MELIAQGAEAVIRKKGSIIIKERIVKSYRHSIIDSGLRKHRTKKEAKILEDLNGIINVPKLIKLDLENFIIEMEFISGDKLADVLETLDLEHISIEMGRQISQMHNRDIIHGDLTTSNMIFHDDTVYFIDFGLSFNSNKLEDKAVDLHLLKCALESKHYKIFEKFFDLVIEVYSENVKDSKQILERLEKVEKRGRHKN